VITLLLGENSFEITRSLKYLETEFEGVTEKIDGEILELKQLPDLLMGATLFAQKRLVIIRNLSENKSVWEKIPDWLDRVSEDVHVVLVESKPDRRSRTYRALQKVATVRQFPAWTDRDTAVAEKWVIGEAERQKLTLDKKSVHSLVERAGVDQWQLYYALQKLAALPEVNSTIIENIVEANPRENVFNLLDAALKGNTAKLQEMLQVLAMSEDSYRLFGLLSTQVFQLALLSISDNRAAGDVAKDIGAHPFALSKLAPHVKKLGKSGVREVVAIMAEADMALKTSATDPWLLIERALLKIANI
jgi:DNA polymerase III delta subunit